MFIWWSDPYAGLTVGFVLLPLALVCGTICARLTRKPLLSRVRRLLLVAWVLVALPWAYISARVLPGFGTEQNQAVPNIELLSSQGSSRKLHDFAGQVVILDFWATWCAPCQASSPALEDLRCRYGSEALRIVGVSADEDESLWRQYLQQHSTQRLEMRDANGQLAQTFHVDGRPTFVLLDRSGRLRWAQVGWTPFSYLVLRYRIRELLSEQVSGPVR